MRNPIRSGRGVRLASALTVLLLAAGTLHAAQLVTFTRGQSIVVQSAEKRGTWYFFTLEGGGEVGVPVAQVASVEDYEAPPAPAGQPPPPVVPAAAVAPPGPQGAFPSGSPQPPLQNSALAPGAGQQAEPSRNPGASPVNVAAPATDDWRYKVRMSGGPHAGGVKNPYGPAGAGIRGQMPAGKQGFGVMKPGGQGAQRVVPIQQQEQQNPPN